MHIVEHSCCCCCCFCRIPVVFKSRRSSQGRGGGEGAHPLHPPPRSAPEGRELNWVEKDDNVDEDEAED